MFAMNFENLDQLYRDSPAAYLHLTQFIRNEFEAARKTLLSSLESGDFLTFSQLKHKIFSTLNTLEDNELMNLLEDIKQKLDDDPSVDASRWNTKLDELFHRLLDNLDKKIEELSEVQVM